MWIIVSMNANEYDINFCDLPRMINKKAKIKKRNMAEPKLIFYQFLRFTSAKKRTMCNLLHSILTASKNTILNKPSVTWLLRA